MRRAFLAIGLCLVAAITSAQPQGPIVENEVKHDTSAALRTMLAFAPREVVTPRVIPIELIPTRAGRARALTLDLAEQLTSGPPPAFNMLFQTDGLGRDLVNFTMTGVPPDTSGAVGTTQFVQAVNNSLLIIDKTTRAVVFGPVLTKLVWKGFGTACETENDGDPIIAFDRIARRWIITQFQVTQGNAQCVAVSATDDATGAYHRYEFRYPAMNDYPKLGVWPDAYYITFNMFRGLSGARACAYERNRMLSGTAARQVCFQLSGAYWSLMPADLDGSRLPPSAAPNPMVSLGDNSKSLDLWRFHVDWSTPSLSTLGIGSAHDPDLNIPVAAFNDACQGIGCVPQGGTAQKLDSLGDRLMMRAAYRIFVDHDALVVNHSVQASNATAAVRWYEIRQVTATPQLFQQGTFSPDGLSRWMGSVAMDGAGNLLAGYTVAAVNTRTGIRAAGRTPADPAGTLSSEVVVVNGAGSQTGASRWGDYSHVSIDPVDDCTFWYTTEFMNKSGKFEWSTKIAAFRFNGCGGGGTTITSTGPRIVFVSSRDGNREIYSMNADGSDVRRLTNNPAPDYSPAPSPDGRRIVFVSERDGNPNIYSMNADGSDQRRLTTSTVADEQPAWLREVTAPTAPAEMGTRDIGMETSPVARTVWGGEGVVMRISTRGPELEFGCAMATLDSPLPAQGPFDIAGTYVERRPGPERIDIAAPAPKPARFVGRVESDRINVRVILASDEVAAEHQLERGRSPRLVKCVSP